LCWRLLFRMRGINVATVILLVMVPAFTLGCAGGVDPGWTTTPTVTMTTPAGQPSTTVQSMLNTVLDGLETGGLFGGHRVVASHAVDVDEQGVVVDVTLCNSTDDEYVDINRSMRDVIDNCTVAVAGYFGPNEGLGDAYGSRTVQVDVYIYGGHIARYYYAPQGVGGAGGDEWSVITFYANPEIYAAYAPPEHLSVYALYNNSSLCDPLDGVTVYLYTTDVNENPTWEPGVYHMEVMTLDNETAYENDYTITSDFLEYPGTTYGINIDASVFDAPKEHLSYVFVTHIRAIDGEELTAWAYIFDALNYCED